MGAGKSTVSQLLREFGYAVFDADILVHEVVLRSDIKKKIIKLFGKKSYAEDGSYNRSYVRTEILIDDEKKIELEKIIHPEIRIVFKEKVSSLIKEGKNLWIFYEATLIFEKKREKEFDAVVLVTCDRKIREKRILSSRSLSPTDVRSLIAKQMPESEKKKKTKLIIKNDGNQAELRTNIVTLLSTLHEIFTHSTS